MVNITLAFRTMGPAFSPSHAEAEANAAFSSKNEPGELGRAGRYRGQPLPYGSAEFVDVDAIATMSGLPSPFLDTLARLAPACRTAGATSLVVHADIAYDGQCNFELNDQCAARLAALGVAMTFTCFENVKTRE